MNKGEIRLCEWQYDMNDGFWKAFWNAAKQADSLNSHALEQGFPEEMQALTRYRNVAGYWDELKTEFWGAQHMPPNDMTATVSEGRPGEGSVAKPKEASAL